MAKKAKGSEEWSISEALSALVAVPAPLANEDNENRFHDALALVQKAPNEAARRKLARAASAEIIRIVDATLKTRQHKQFADTLLFGLKVLAYLGTPEGADAVIRAARKPLDPTSYLWSVVLGVFGGGHAGAAHVLGELANPLPEGFLCVSLLDAANEACREHGLRQHPFDTRAGQERLAGYLKSRKPAESSYAVSACAALPFLSPARRKPLVALARKHTDHDVQMEAAWATARMGEKTGLAFLVQACKDANFSEQARQYLKELKQQKLIPKEAKAPDFVAMSEMCAWLAHPNEFGEPPDRITMMDKRKLYWPPTKDERVVRLYKYEYDKSRHRPEKDVGVGMVGSMTFALFGESTPDMSPEELYGMHCAWELECGDDPRAPRNRTGKAGWKLIQSRA